MSAATIETTVSKSPRINIGNEVSFVSQDRRGVLTAFVLSGELVDSTLEVIKRREIAEPLGKPVNTFSPSRTGGISFRGRRATIAYDADLPGFAKAVAEVNPDIRNVIIHAEGALATKEAVTFTVQQAVEQQYPDTEVFVIPTGEV